MTYTRTHLSFQSCSHLLQKDLARTFSSSPSVCVTKSPHGKFATTADHRCQHLRLHLQRHCSRSCARYAHASPVARPSLVGRHPQLLFSPCHRANLVLFDSMTRFVRFLVRDSPFRCAARHAAGDGCRCGGDDDVRCVWCVDWRDHRERQIRRRPATEKTHGCTVLVLE